MTNPNPSPNPSPSPMPRTTSGYTQLGAQIGDFPGSTWRIAALIIGVIALLIALTGSIGDIEFDNGYRIIFVVLAIACAVQFYYGYGAHAQLFERGFIISRAGKTVSGRWEDIARFTHEIKRSYYFGFIPEPWKSHTVTLTKSNGERVRICSTYFRNTQQLADTINQKWRQAVAAAAAKRENAVLPPPPSTPQP